MTNNYINVSVTSRQNQKVSVSTPPPSAEVTATTDTGKFWALIAERWATSNAIVENKDYSSKYYANQSKLSATNAKTYESAVKNTYNTFLEVSSDAIAEIQSTKEETLTDIENSSNEIKNDIVNDIKATGFYIKDGDIYYLDENGNEQKFYSDIKFIVREY